MSENIIAGLVSGVLATFLVFVFRSFWVAVLTPWFEERVYKDIKIEGKWFSLYPSDSGNRQEVISLDRRGHAITGTIVCATGGDAGEKYQVSGSFRNMLLPLAYESTDSSKSDRGTITLKSIHNGERLAGKLAFYNTLDDSITTTNIVWFRKKSDLEKFILEKEKNKNKIMELRQQATRIDTELKEVEGVTERTPKESIHNEQGYNAVPDSKNG